MNQNRKRINAAVLALLLGAAQLTACGKAQSAPETTTAAETEAATTAAELPNPMQPVENEKEFETIGIHMVTPPDAENPLYFIISGAVAEIQFTKNGADYSFRASNTAEDFAGIFERFKEETLTVEASTDQTEALIKTTESGGRLASWSWGETDYTLYTAASIEDEEIQTFVQEMLELTCHE